MILGFEVPIGQPLFKGLFLRVALTGSPVQFERLQPGGMQPIAHSSLIVRYRCSPAAPPSRMWGSVGQPQRSAR